MPASPFSLSTRGRGTSSRARRTSSMARLARPRARAGMDGRAVEVRSGRRLLRVRIPRRLQTAIALRDAGFDAKYMKGGHSGWKAIGGPVKPYDEGLQRRRLGRDTRRAIAAPALPLLTDGKRSHHGCFDRLSASAALAETENFDATRRGAGPGWSCGVTGTGAALDRGTGPSAPSAPNVLRQSLGAFPWCVKEECRLPTASSR